MPDDQAARGPILGIRRWLTMLAVVMIAADIGRNAEAGLDRREAERALHEVGQEQEQREHRDAGQPDRRVGAAAGAVGDDAQRQQRVLDAALDRDEARSSSTTAAASMTIVSGWPQECVSAFEKP